MKSRILKSISGVALMTALSLAGAALRTNSLGVRAEAREAQEERNSQGEEARRHVARAGHAPRLSDRRRAPATHPCPSHLRQGWHSDRDHYGLPARGAQPRPRLLAAHGRPNIHRRLRSFHLQPERTACLCLDRDAEAHANDPDRR